MATTVEPEGLRIQVSQLRSRLLKAQTLRVFGVRGLGVVALLGFEVVLARSLGVSGYGAFSFTLAVVAVVSRLAPLGWLNAGTRFVSAYAASANLGLLKGAIITAHVATGAGLAAAACLILLFDMTFGTQSSRDTLGFVLPIMAALAILELHRYLLRGLGAGDLGEAFVVLLLPGLAAAAVWGLAIPDPAGAASIYGAICAGLVLASTLSIARLLPPAFWRAQVEFRTRDWSLAALAMLLGGASDELSARAAILVLGAAAAPEQAGLYQAAARLALMNVFVLRVVTPVAAPRISALYQEGRLSELRLAYRRLCLISIAGALPFFLLFMLFPAYILDWFGSDFVESASILRVLSLGYLASAAAGPCATALMMIGCERIYAALAFGSLLASAVATYILAQYLGGLGAATATASVLIINNIIYLAIFLRATAPQSQKSALCSPGNT